MHVHLLVPDLLVADLLVADRLAGPAGELRLESAELLIAKGRRSAEDASPEAWLKHRYGMDEASDAGMAAWSLLGEGIAPGDSCWLRSDPVHLRVDRDALMLGDATLFGVSNEEAAALSAHLNS